MWLIETKRCHWATSTYDLVFMNHICVRVMFYLFGLELQVTSLRLWLHCHFLLPLSTLLLKLVQLLLQVLNLTRKHTPNLSAFHLHMGEAPSTCAQQPAVSYLLQMRFVSFFRRFERFLLHFDFLDHVSRSLLSFDVCRLLPVQLIFLSVKWLSSIKLSKNSSMDYWHRHLNHRQIWPK